MVVLGLEYNCIFQHTHESIHDIWYMTHNANHMVYKVCTWCNVMVYAIIPATMLQPGAAKQLSYMAALLLWWYGICKCFSEWQLSVLWSMQRSYITIIIQRCTSRCSATCLQSFAPTKGLPAGKPSLLTRTKLLLSHQQSTAPLTQKALCLSVQEVHRLKDNSASMQAARLSSLKEFRRLRETVLKERTATVHYQQVWL